MIDLNRFGSGRNLVKKVIENSKSKNQPWSKKKQNTQLKTQKNSHSLQSRLTNK